MLCAHFSMFWVDDSYSFVCMQNKKQRQYFVLLGQHLADKSHWQGRHPIRNLKQFHIVFTNVTDGWFFLSFVHFWPIMVRRRKCMFQKSGFLAKNPFFSMGPRFLSKDHQSVWTRAPHRRWTRPEIFFRFRFRPFFVIVTKKSYPPSLWGSVCQ